MNPRSKSWHLYLISASAFRDETGHSSRGRIGGYQMQEVIRDVVRRVHMTSVSTLPAFGRCQPAGKGPTRWHPQVPLEVQPFRFTDIEFGNPQLTQGRSK